MKHDRDKLVPKHPAAPDTPWHEEPTGVHTDPQIFRSLKGLRDDLEANKREAAAAHQSLKRELDGVKDDVTAIKATSTETSLLTAKMSGQLDVLLADRRSGSKSGDPLAKHLAEEQRDGKQFRHKLLLTIASGVFSAGVLVALLHYWLG